jgi:sulfite reductase beta subunit-like hemoprotein
VIIGSPVAGIAADEIVDGTWAIEQIRNKYIGSPEFSNLPRKFKTAISGSPAMDVVHEINDVSFVGVNHPELGPGFDLWVGGGLSVAPMFAKRLGAFVRLEQVPDVWAGVIGIFRDYGYRRLRNRARLKFLMADIGPEKFRDILETEYLGYRLPDGPGPVTPPTGTAITSGSTSRRTARSGSVPRRSPAGSAARSCARSPTSPSATAVTASASPRTRSCSSSTSRRPMRRRSSRSSRHTT